MQKSITFKFGNGDSSFYAKNVCVSFRLCFGSSYFKNLKYVFVNTVLKNNYLRERGFLIGIVFILEFDEILDVSALSLKTTRNTLVVRNW